MKIPHAVQETLAAQEKKDEPDLHVPTREELQALATIKELINAGGVFEECAWTNSSRGSYYLVRIRIIDRRIEVACPVPYAPPETMTHPRLRER